jgi:hypothetical protein
MKQYFLIGLVFVAGVMGTEYFKRYGTYLDELKCGIYKPGWTTVVAYDDGELICVYRQQDWPQKTHSGRST